MVVTKDGFYFMSISLKQGPGKERFSFNLNFNEYGFKGGNVKSAFEYEPGHFFVVRNGQK